MIRRNPRRGSSSKGSEEDDPMDIDEESNTNPAADDDSDEMPISKLSSRRRTGSATNASKNNSQSTSNSRRSSRSNKFNSSMKEPNPNSVRDLFIETDGTTSARAAKGRKAEEEDYDDSSSDEDEDVPIRRSKKQQPKKSAPKNKSPARRHARARKSAKGDLSESSDEESSEGEWDDDDGEEDEEMKIQRILGSRLETKAKWREICKKMNTSEVTDGSRWFQEKRNTDDDDVIEERFLVKWAGLSYLHVSWETQADLFDQIEGAKTYFSTFFRKSVGGVLFSADERKDGDYFDPGYVQIDRILAVEFDGGKIPKTPEEEDAAKPSDFDIVTDTSKPDEFETGVGRQILVKWESLNYSESSYEFERDLMLAEIEYKDDLKEFYKRTKKPTKMELKTKGKEADKERRRGYLIFGDRFTKNDEAKKRDVDKYQKDLAEHVFKNGGQLRDYQAEGVSWFLSNYLNNRSCILADEMGLGKVCVFYDFPFLSFQ